MCQFAKLKDAVKNTAASDSYGSNKLCPKETCKSEDPASKDDKKPPAKTMRKRKPRCNNCGLAHIQWPMCRTKLSRDIEKEEKG